MLKIGDKGPGVQRWQEFLVSAGLLDDADGDFGAKTEAATKAFQSQAGLDADGVAGSDTFAAAKAAGMPSGPKLRAMSVAEKQVVFGPLAYVPNPAVSLDAIKITNNWARNLKNVHVPQLSGISGAPKNCIVAFHAKGADKLVELWARWEQAGLLSLVLTWDGAWAPRFVRGSQSTLSSHAFATAFDINARWNPLNKAPAPSGKTGSVIDLVPIAAELGFFWGGSWEKRPDAMHFELGAENESL